MTKSLDSAFTTSSSSGLGAAAIHAPADQLVLGAATDEDVRSGTGVRASRETCRHRRSRPWSGSSRGTRLPWVRSTSPSRRCPRWRPPRSRTCPHPRRSPRRRTTSRPSQREQRRVLVLIHAVRQPYVRPTAAPSGRARPSRTATRGTRRAVSVNPVERSSSAHDRSPTSPCGPMSMAATASPWHRLHGGYRQSCSTAWPMFTDPTGRAVIGDVAPWHPRLPTGNIVGHAG